MKDQVGALKEAGIPAAYINSALSMAEADMVFSSARRGEYKLLYVAPERLLAPSFLRFSNNTDISMVTVDEAHCISQWGQDFRPSYLTIIDFLKQLPKRPIVSAFTATATAHVRDDIIRILGLNTPLLMTASFDRPNLYFSLLKPASRNAELLGLIKARTGKSGIVYCSTRKTVDSVCTFLLENSINATRYHAGLGADERQRNQDAFLYDEKTVMVATNAFGMGIDKSNVSFVIHYNMPKDMESYYQEAGRAGRDGEPADCILLYSGRDVHTAEFLITHGRDENESMLSQETREKLIERDRERLRMMTFYSTTTDCLRHFILSYFGEDSPISCGHCGNCDTKFDTIDATIDAQKILSCVFRLRKRQLSFGKIVVAAILTGTKNEKIDTFSLDTLSTYGIMSDYTTKRVRQLIDLLIERGKLGCDPNKYNTLFITKDGDKLMRGRDSFTVRMPKEEKSASERREVGFDREVDQNLFERLRALRTKLAKRAGVPPYIVFSNATLSELSSQCPVTLGEFIHVHGVGEVKAQRYGEEFINEIKAYISEKDE